MRKPLIAIALAAGTSLAWGLEIVEATYGAGEKKVDFKQAFEKLRRNDSFYCGKLDANRMAGTDPAKGVKKQVTVRYRDAADGQEKSVTFGERDFAAIADGVKASEEFTFSRAWFGAGDSYVDVTDAMRKIIENGKEAFLDMRALGVSEDPVRGKRKNTIIFYSSGGRIKVADVLEKTKFNPAKIGAPVK
ncbi:MAG: hypothetical protein HPZ91_09020 [Lentisphaeria bacterium]|nr:hypothetical protein [Lentisphaeria bacterium]